MTPEARLRALAEREYDVEVRVVSFVTVTVKAASKKEARAKIAAWDVVHVGDDERIVRTVQSITLAADGGARG